MRDQSFGDRLLERERRAALIRPLEPFPDDSACVVVVPLFEDRSYIKHGFDEYGPTRTPVERRPLEGIILRTLSPGGAIRDERRVRDLPFVPRRINEWRKSYAIGRALVRAESIGSALGAPFVADRTFGNPSNSLER